VAAVTQKARQDEQAIAELVSSGVAPVKTVYHDGGSHESFVTAMAGVSGSDGSLVVDTRMRNKFGDISRPEGLSSGPQEIALDDTGKPKKEAPSTALAFASAPKAAAPVAAAAPIAAPAPDMKVASSAAPAAATGTADTESPFYKKMLNGIGGLFSTSPAPQPATETAQVAAPLPPLRGVATAKPANPAVPQKRAQAPTPINFAAAQ
jgi:hypothetical protein